MHSAEQHDQHCEAVTTSAGDDDDGDARSQLLRA
jgi:hypothetical protein